MRKAVVSITLTLFMLAAPMLSKPLYAGVKEGIAAYERGDYETALREFKTSPEQGNAGVHALLGMMYYLGQGVARDYVLSYKWLNLGASGGIEDARSLLDDLETKMTPEQIAEAQRLSREFKVEGSIQ